MTDTFIKQPHPFINEDSSFNATVYFRSSANAAEAPTTAKYRVDCLTTNKVLTDWTTLTPAVSISIALTATHNAMQSEYNKREKKQLTVSANHGDADQTRDNVTWFVRNNDAF